MTISMVPAVSVELSHLHASARQKLCYYALIGLRLRAPDSTWTAIRDDGAIVGFAALVPGETGYCHATAFLAPAARNHGIGLRSTALEMGRHLIAEASARGYLAIAANPADQNTQRYCTALGFQASGVELPMRGPAVIRRLRPEAEEIAPDCIVRRCFPDVFAAAGEMLSLLNKIPLLSGNGAAPRGGLDSFTPRPG